MNLTDEYKIERLDDKNIAVFQKFRKKKDSSDFQWNAISYHHTFEEAIRYAIKHLTLDQLKYTGELSDVLTELSNCRNAIARIAKRLGGEIKKQEE